MSKANLLKVPDAADTAPDELPPPLPEPAVGDLRLETILGALADPLRLTVVRKLMLEMQAYDHACGWFGFDRPKSSLTHHFKALREAGVIRQRQYGLERRSRLRTEDLDARFPGLLALVAAWQPPAPPPKKKLALATAA
jgi:DNA-binding transcriptional ArsR family regulator